MQFDVRVQTAPDISFESSLAQDIQVEGNLRLQGSPYNPVLLGRLNITQGEINFFGTRYIIHQGSLTFANPVKLEPVLNVDLTTRVQGIDVTLTISGPVNKLNITPRSDPPMSYSDVLALLATGSVSAMAFFSTVVGDKKIYQLLYNASSLSGFLIWLGIAVCHLRFRKAWVAQGRSLNDLKFRSKFYPYGPWLALVLFLVVLFGANISVFQTEVFSWFDFVTDYLIIPTVIVLYLGHKIWNKTHVVPLKECNFDPG